MLLLGKGWERGALPLLASELSDGLTFRAKVPHVPNFPVFIFRGITIIQQKLSVFNSTKTYENA